MSEFDELLDGLLREGNDVEPPLGMEQRVLARVRESAAERVFGRRWVPRLWWGLGGVLAGAVVILGLWMPKDFQKKDVRRVSAGLEEKANRNEGVPVRASEGVDANSAAARVVRVRSDRVRFQKVDVSSSAREELPKLDVFPAPVQLSAEERALMEFGREHPEEAKKLVATDKTNTAIKPLETAPIQIAALVIEPINIDARGEER